MDYIINKIMNNITQTGEYDEEQIEIIRYGLELLLLKITFTIGALFIGALMGCFISCVIFLGAFTCLRSLAGGYHARTRLLCALESSALLVGCLWGMKLACGNIEVELIIYIVAVIVAIWVWKNGPIDCENKRLEEDEKQIIRKKMRRCLLMEGIAGGIFAVMRITIVSTGIAFAMVATAILVSGGMWTNKCKQKNSV